MANAKTSDAAKHPQNRLEAALDNQPLTRGNEKILQNGRPKTAVFSTYAFQHLGPGYSIYSWKSTVRRLVVVIVAVAVVAPAGLALVPRY